MPVNRQGSLLLGSSRPATSGAVLSLRDYQRAALDAVHEARARGVTRQLVSLPTGAGKTFVAAHMVSEIGLPTVFLVHRDELARQTVRQMRQVNPDLSIGVVQADRDEIDRQIVVASAQTLARETRLERLRRAVGAGCLFISDEAHHDRAPSRMRAIERMEPELLVGLTATPMRGDKLGLDAVYDEIVYHLPMRVLVERGHLARPIGLRIETDADLDRVHTRGGEFVQDELSETVDTQARNELIVDSWKRHATGRQRTVAFCVNVKHAERLRDAFRAAGVTAEMIDGSTPILERQRIFEAFRRGDIAVLTNCMVLTEGFDEPGIDCVLMARPTKSTALYVQCVGRGLRKYPGKRDCLVIDFVDATTRHQLVTLPTLSGIEKSEAGETGKALAEISEANRKPGQVIDLFDAMAHEGRIRERAAIMLDLLAGSSFVWNTSPNTNRYVAKAGENQWLTLLAEGDGYVPARVIAPRGEQPRIVRLFNRPLDAEAAMEIAERSIEESPLTSRDAAWRRRDEPPTDGQLRFARRLGIRVPKTATKAQVAELIDSALFERAMQQLGRVVGHAV